MHMRSSVVRLWLLSCLLLAWRLSAQNVQTAVPGSPVLTPELGQIDLELGYTANQNNLTDGTKILLQGGSVELTGHLLRGFAGVASVTGLHTGATSSGVPQNLVIAVFGPRFTFAESPRAGHTERTSAFIQALVGEANGFDGVFPNKTGSDSSANGLAFKVGGGLDIAIKSHLGARIVQVEFLQTQLPNGTTNIQRSVLIGAGIVWHTRSHYCNEKCKLTA